MRALPRLGLFPQKEAVPLKRKLSLLDTRKLGPRYERNPATDRLPTMSEDMIDSLGTRDYLQLLLTDTLRQPGESTRVVNLFVTYYTGQPDMVPHVPDECYLAGGYDSLGSATHGLPVRDVGAPGDEIPVRLVRFRAPPNRRQGMLGSDEVAVAYFFLVNGGFAATRDGVRLRLSAPFERYAYYAKVEVTFLDESISRPAGPEATLAGLSPLLERLLPVLYEDHLNLSYFEAAGGTRDQTQP